LDDIASTAEEAASATEESSASTEEMTASMSQMASSAQELSQMAVSLREMVGKFKVSAPENTIRPAVAHKEETPAQKKKPVSRKIRSE
jgi:hypothetical protein